LSDASSPWFKREDWILLVLAAGSFVLAWGFTKFASEVLEGELLRIDHAVQQFVAANRVAGLRPVFLVITQFGTKELLAPLSVILAWWLFRATKAMLAMLVFAAIAAGEFVAVLKRDFHVLRPAVGVAKGLGYSFPSGHATGSMAIAVLLTYVAVRQRVHPVAIGVCSFATVVLVGVSRVYLDVHWASDVLGGWFVGGAFGAGCSALYEILHRRTERRAGADPVTARAPAP